MRSFNKLHFIVNEHSTRGANAKTIIEKKLKKYKNLSYEMHLTKEPKDGIHIISRIAPHINPSDLIVAAGGDGTLSEVVNGLEKNNIENPLAYIPMGSGNDFAISNNIPRNIDNAIEHLFEIEQTKEIDLIKIKINDSIRYAVNSCGVGIDGRVIHSIEATNNQKKFGRLSYLSQVLRGLFKQDKFNFTIILDEKKIDVKDSLLVLSANQGHLGGGIHIHPNVDSTDGLLDVLFVDDVKLIDIPVVIFHILFTKKHLSHKKFNSYRAKSVELILHSEEYSQADGELLGYAKHHHTYETSSRKFWI